MTFTAQRHSAEEHLKSSSILIVDDKAENVFLLESILAQAGYTNVSSLTDPTQVERHYVEHGFDLLLLDIRMPKMDGFEVLDRLSRICDDDYLSVLVLTAQTDTETKLKALELGAKDFITKPFLKQEVQLRIANMLEVRNAYNEKRRLNEILEERVVERTAQVVDTQFEIIRRLARAGEYRDNETGMHVIRVGKGTQLLARALGHGEHFSELAMHASTMHDVGKIGVPDRVLLKPGKLDDEEWEFMRSHAEIGGNILEGHTADVMQMAQVIAISHHEKWDGTGYPYGLRGDDIPVEGRITAICDVFDALTSHRPYKEAWPVERAVEEIKRGAGTHFDPQFVPKFVGVLPGIVKLRETYSDDNSDFTSSWTDWICKSDTDHVPVISRPLATNN